MKRFGKILFLLQVMWSSSVWAQNFQATVNRTEVPQGETFLLTLETDDDKSSDTPDLSVLDENFNIYSVGNAYQSTYINGVSKHSRQWQIILMPKNAGQIEIPAIKFGNMSSEPIILNVVPSQLAQQNHSSQSKDTDSKFAVEAEVDNTHPYVQQQINYTFKIYDSGGLYGEEPKLASENDDWIIKRLGEPVINSKIINGRSLREIEFKYALFPQKSGKLKAPDFVFEGYYLTKSRRGADDFDDIFNQGFFNMGFSDLFASRNPIMLRPDSINIDVKPIPAANGGYWWLPASEVTLSAEWENKNPTFRVGEAVSRSIYIKAAGVIDTQLPNLKFAEIEGVKQYPDKPVTMSTQDKGKVVSVKKFGNVFIPEKSGEITLPEVSIDWYNIHTKQLEKSVLPAQKIKVLPALKGEESALPQIEPEEISQQPQVSHNKATSLAQPISQNNIPAWLWIIVAFLLGLFCSWLLFGRRTQAEKKNANDYIKQIKEAVKTENSKELRDSLIGWMQETNPDKKINNLDDVIACVGNKALKEQVTELNILLYSPKKADFKPDVFLKAFAEEQKKSKKSTKKFDPLPKLYK